jgi:glycosyltransferase involved in cell wall biosynthesis
VLNWVSWWFAHTGGNASYLETEGVPASKITVLWNSVDTRDIRDHVRGLVAKDRAAIRGQLGIPVSAPVGIFILPDSIRNGRPFALSSMPQIKARMPAFHLILVGGGPEQNAILRLIQGLEWVHWVGPTFGKMKANFMAIFDALLLPYKVGLAILDAFAAGLPLVTTHFFEFYAPEFEYLEQDVNGLICEANPGAFAEAVLLLA